MWFPPLVVFLLGIALAQLYKSRDRARYDGIGRYLHEDIAIGDVDSGRGAPQRAAPRDPCGVLRERAHAASGASR